MSKYIDFQTVKSVPIRDILRRVGIHPIREKGDDLWYLCPWRSESQPSLHVRQSINQWTDFGEQKSGTDCIDLVIRLGIAKTSYEAASWIYEQFLSFGDKLPTVPSNYKRNLQAPASTQRIDSNGARILEIKPISRGKLASYFSDTRKIPFSVLSTYCSEIHYTTAAALACYGAGIANIRGGYAVRNPMNKINIAPASITLLRRGSKACLLFEGMTDFLSFITLFPGNDDDKIILNSVKLLDHALPLLGDYQRIECYLDNDKAGKDATVEIQDTFGKVVLDKASLYYGHKDLNDYLKALIK